VLKFHTHLYAVKLVVSRLKVGNYTIPKWHSYLLPVVTLQTAASRTSLLPIVMQTPVASVETSGGRSTWLWGMPFLTETAVRPFLPAKRSVR
jgi:hypothetical protein